MALACSRRVLRRHAVAVLLAGCTTTAADAAPGTETGPCIEGQCFDDLECLSDRCLGPHGDDDDDNDDDDDETEGDDDDDNSASSTSPTGASTISGSSTETETGTASTSHDTTGTFGDTETTSGDETGDTGDTSTTTTDGITTTGDFTTTGDLTTSGDSATTGDFTSTGAFTSTGLFGSCDGHCGGQSPGTCWCDDACMGFGDCCEDVCDPGICDDDPEICP